MVGYTPTFSLSWNWGLELWGRHWTRRRVENRNSESHVSWANVFDSGYLLFRGPTLSCVQNYNMWGLYNKSRRPVLRGSEL